jgi:hypothetical protein
MPQHTHTHTHARTHTHAHTHTHARSHARTHAHTHTHTHARTHTHAHTHTHARSHAHTRTHSLRTITPSPSTTLTQAVKRGVKILCPIGPSLGPLSLQLHFGCLLPNAYIGKTQSLKCRHPVRALNLIFGLIDITVAYMAGAPKVSFVSCSLQPTSPETTIGGWHPLQVGLGNTALPICIQ